MAKIAILGFGTVGSGVYEVLCRNAAGVSRRAGEPVEVKYILDPKDFSGHPAANLFVKSIDTILQDPEVRVVVETIGGTRFAYPYVKACLESGRSVCTSNKEMVATYGAELLGLAKAHDCAFLFEASVGGGTPIITPMHQCLAANVISQVQGIVNGTTNFMLTKMVQESLSFDDALRIAQELGYAETKDPSDDVDGRDACRKIAILSSLISGQQVDFEDIYCEGITEVTVEDMKYAREMGMTIKLLASSKRQGERLHAIVAPCLLYPEHPLYNVNGVFNSIFVHGNVLGDAMFYGSGAGKLPTASAVVSDVVEAAKNLHRNVMTMWKQEKLKIEDKADAKRRFFIRMKGDPEAMLSDLQYSFGEIRIVRVPGLSGEFGFTTPVMMEGDYDTRAKRYEDQILHMIRIEDLDGTGE